MTDGPCEAIAVSDGDHAAVRALLEHMFPGGGEARLVEALRESGAAEIELIARRAEGVVAHVLFSAMASPRGALGLGPVATAEAHRGQGLASDLIREGLRIARDRGFTAVFVLGEAGFYERIGFSAKLAARWVSPYAGPWFQGLELTDGALAEGGRAEYPAPFGDL